MRPGKRQLSSSQVKEILKAFPDLKAWRAGLHHGSIIYFELGDRIRDRPLRGEAELRGSAYLGIWADDWAIRQHGGLIASSKTVTRAVMEGDVQRLVSGLAICGFDLEPGTGTARVWFQDGLSVAVDFRAEQDDNDLIQLHVPDGRIISLSKGLGFYVSDDVDETLLLHWRERERRA